MKKTCKTCNGDGRVHLESCDTKRIFDTDCTCGYPPCEACGGTGIRRRHKDIRV